MPKLGEAYVNIRANLAPLRRGLAAAKSIVSRGLGMVYAPFKGVFNAIGNLVKKVMDKIVRYIKRAMLAVAAAMAYGIYEFARFQKQLAMVSTMLDDKTMPILKQFETDLVRLAKKYGQATATLSKGLYDILSASIDASKAVGVLEVATKAAVGGITQTEVAADALTSILNSYGLAAGKAEEVSDKMFATVKRGKLTYEELAHSIGMAAATSAVAGLRLEELLAILATATRAGISASRATFSIVAALNSFMKPADDAKDMAKKYGVELSTNTLKTEGLVKSLQKLEKATAEELAVVVPTVRGFKSFAAALKDMTGLQTDVTLITEKYAGMADEAYKKMGGSLVMLKDRTLEHAKAAVRAFGAPMRSALVRIAAEFSALFQKLENWLKENEATIEKWANWAIDKVIEVGEFFKGLYDITKKYGIGATLKYLFAKTTDMIADVFMFIKGQWPAIKEAVEKIWGVVEPILVKAFEAVRPHAEALGKKIATGFKTGITKVLKPYDVGEGISAYREATGRLGKLRLAAAEKGFKEPMIRGYASISKVERVAELKAMLAIANNTRQTKDELVKLNSDTVR